MEHMDEKITELRNKAQEEIPKKIFFTINKEEVEFEERNLLEDKIKILLPKEFQEMPKEIAALKYPSERRPTLILTNESTSINISFNHTESIIEDQR